MIYNNDDMLMYINETQKYALQILEKSEELTRDFSKMFASKDYKRIMLVASGTSYNSCLTAKHFIEEVLKVPAVLNSSYDYAHYNTIFNSDDLVIAVTQEGESTNTVDAIKKAKEKGVDTVTVTEYLNNTCTKLADLKVTIDCDREFFGPKTKGYTCTVLTLYIMALEAGYKANRISEEEYKNYKTALKKSLDNIPLIIKESEEWIKRNEAELVACEKAYVVGYGPHAGTALEGALKSLETVRYFYFSFDTEEFLHGPLASVRSDVYTFIISPKNDDYERNHGIFTGMSKYNEHVFSIGDQGEENNDHVLSGSFTDDKYMSVFEYIIPLQLLAYRTFKGKGIDLNVREYPRISDYIKTKTDQFRK